MKYEHLIGIAFKLGSRDCYELARDFYRENCGLQMGDYARPSDFATSDLDLFTKIYAREGFRLIDVHPVDLKPGDGFLMAINNSRANHCAIYLGLNQILHHCFGRMSSVDVYKGIWKNNTVAVLRHPTVVSALAVEQHPIDLMDHLAPVLRVRLQQAKENARNSQPAS